MDQASYTPASADEVLRFQQERIIKNLFRGFLEVLEDVEEDHNNSLDRLVEALPEEQKKLVDLADHLTPEKGQQLRKRVLDRGNGALRDLDTLLKGYLISFK